MNYAAEIEKTQKRLEENRADTRKDYILRFPSGFSIKFDDKGEPMVTNAAGADTIATADMPEEAWAFIPVVRNGKGETAEIIRRDGAIEKDNAALEELIKFFSKMVNDNNLAVA